MSRSQWMTLALCLGFCATVATPGGAQFKLDHFRAYDVDPVRVREKIELQGQFDTGPIATRLRSLVKFANPVSKNGAPILDRNAHLTWYRIRSPKEDVRTVLATNQFGKDQELRLGQPMFLLAPAAKKEGGGESPERLDHFKCYEVLEGKPIGKVVSLSDQFGKTEVTVTKPRFFCVPVDKKHGDKVFERYNHEDHLTVYDIVYKINVNDQFNAPETRPLSVKTCSLLCVPSKKRITEVDPKLDHFRFYVTDQINVQAKPTVRGQFDAGQAKTISLASITHFATPVSKNDEGIIDKHAHLTFYRFEEPQSEPSRTIEIKNQFGKQTIHTRRAVALLVPSEKIEAGSMFPKNLEHFKCYEVAQGNSIGKSVTLADQFPPMRTVDVRKPRFFCVPVMKRHNNKITEIKDDESHLTIYRTTATPDTEQTRETRDQFGTRPIRILRGVWLGVPTEKLDFVEH